MGDRDTREEGHCDDPANSAKGESSTGQMTASMNTQDGNGGWVREMLQSKRFKSLGLY